MRRIVFAALLLALVGWTSAEGGASSLVIGAVYPTSGPQAGPGAGLDEYHGLLLAAEYVNAHGGVRGRPVRVRLAPAGSPDAAPVAVDRLAESGVTVIAGTYGTVIAAPAAETAARLGLLYWETGAVGEIGDRAAPGRHFFRVAPSGAMLGKEAVDFVHDGLAPRLRRIRPLRYTVAYVNDAFGRAEARGEVAEIRGLHLPLAAVLPYDPRRVDYAGLAARIAGARTDVLVVAAYMENAVGLRAAVLRARVPLLVNIGGCSAYIMPQFGQRLGAGAVGVFSSDKVGDLVPARVLDPAAAGELRWAQRRFRERYGHPLWEPGLSGFTGGIALFRYVLPRASDPGGGCLDAAARRGAQERGRGARVPRGARVRSRRRGARASPALCAGARRHAATPTCRRNARVYGGARAVALDRAGARQRRAARRPGAG